MQGVDITGLLAFVDSPITVILYECVKADICGFNFRRGA